MHFKERRQCYVYLRITPNPCRDWRENFKSGMKHTCLEMKMQEERNKPQKLRESVCQRPISCRFSNFPNSFWTTKRKYKNTLCLTTLQLFWLQLLGNVSVKSFQRLWYFSSWATECHKGYGTNMIFLPLSLVQHSMEHWSFWPWRKHYGKEGEVDILITWHKWQGASELYPLSRQCLIVTRILGKGAPVCHKSGYPKGYENLMLFTSCMLRRKCSHPTWDPQVPSFFLFFFFLFLSYTLYTVLLLLGS